VSAIHLLGEGGAAVVEYSTPPEAIDDAFRQILAEELMWKTAPSDAPGEESSHHHDSAGVTPSAPRAKSVASSARLSPARQPVGPPTRGSDVVAAHWRVRVIEEKGPEQLVTFSHGPVTVGRSPVNTIAVRCPRVSRKQIRIWLDEAGPWAEDLSGRGRMRVNGTRMPSSRLQPNDVIEIGSVRIYIEYLGPDRYQAS
jgi:hypothetical protein